MSLRTYLVIALALICGISSAFGIGMIVRQPNAAAAVETVAIAVASSDLARFVPITESNVEWKQMPKDMVPPGALMRSEDIRERAPRIDIPKQDYILDHMLSKKGSKTVAAAIPPGKCAFPVQGSNVSGFVQPGDRVDVILTIKQKSGEFRAVTVLTMVDVMAVNGSLVPTLDAKTDGKEPYSVTLLLTQEQARDLDEGQKQGTIRLTLRNIGDNQPAPVTRLADLKLGSFQEETKTADNKPVAEPIRQPPAPPQIRTLRGTQAGVEFVPQFPEIPAKP